MDKNQHIKEYLRYYISFSKPPRFAVMLNGPWGIGKTHMLKSFLKEAISSETKLAYVSLNGLNSIDEIDDALFRATYRFADNKAVRLVGRAAKAGLKYWKAEIDVRDLVNKTDADIVVFDDLERCSLPINNIFGYINEFVEHEERKVIIVGYEAEIQDDYVRTREKVIGRTFEVQSLFDQAIESFFDDLQDAAAKKFIQEKKDVIAQIFELSKLQNLRILQQAIWDFERFFGAVSEDHRANDLAMSSLMSMMLAISFELRAGRLSPEDLYKRPPKYLQSFRRLRDNSTPLFGFAAAQARYAVIELESTALSDQTLSDFLVKGLVDKEQIHNDLNASSFFVKVANEPPWRTVWYSSERTEQEFDEALAKMEEDFIARRFTEIGVILHVIGLRLWLSKIGTLEIETSQIVDESKKYIEDIYKSERLQPAPIGQNMSVASFEGYAGLGIFEDKTEDYANLFDYLSEKRQLARSKQYKIMADSLLNDLNTNPELFNSRVSFKDGIAGDLCHVPLLASIDPNEFVATLIKFHPSTRRSVLTSLYVRYSDDNINRDLLAERSWALEMRAKLLEASACMSPVAKHWVISNVTYTLDKVLGQDTDAIGERVAK